MATTLLFVADLAAPPAAVCVEIDDGTGVAHHRGRDGVGDSGRDLDGFLALPSGYTVEKR